MSVFKILSLFGLLSLIFYISCSSPKDLNIQVPESGKWFDYISDYGLFSFENNRLIPNKKLVKYEVINALFSDYAEKDRFVYMPEGKTATLLEDGFFDWPEGAVIVKNFAYSSGQMKPSRIMETRLLIKERKDWKAISYVWDDQQKKAKISKVGAVFPLEIQHLNKTQKFDYVVPNKNQCKSCHNKNENIDPLGFKFANLDMEVNRVPKRMSQIDYLIDMKIITVSKTSSSINTMASYKDKNAPIQDRALAYLDVNCGHCHRPEGPGNTSGLFLQYNEKRANHLGFCKGPVAAGKGSGGRSYDIAPGSADESILLYRMQTKDPGEMMPEIGRSLVHEEGVELIKEWINSIDYDCNSQQSF